MSSVATTTAVRTRLATSQSPSSFSVHLDMIRGVAALVVLFGHGKNILFGNYVAMSGAAELVHHHENTRGLGDQAVIVFFTLSGYLIGSGVLKTLRANTWSWRDYLLNRMSRLWVALVPALLIGALWDVVGMHLFGQSDIYLGQGWQSVLEGSVASRFSLKVLFGNSLFLQTISVPYFGSNRALWSLTYEFWFYILFPIILLAVWRKTQSRFRIAYAILGVLIASFVGVSVLGGFVLWLLGVGISLLPVLPSGKATNLATCFSSLLLIGALGVTRVLSLPYFAANLIVAVGCCSLLYALRSYRQACSVKIYRDVAQWLARSSYSLYLVHLPPLVFLTAALHAPWKSHSGHAALFLPILLAVFCYANVIYLMFEANTARVRHFVGRSLQLILRDRKACAETIQST